MGNFTTLSKQDYEKSFYGKLLKKILVIQNSKDNVHQIDAILPVAEFEIFYSHNQQDGLEISCHYLPDLILFFIDGTDNGIDILSRISNEEKTSSIPLVVISEMNSFHLQRKAMDLGADDYLTAELLEKSLLICIKKRLDKLSKLKESISNQINSFEDISGNTKKDNHILVKIGNKLKLVKFDEIVCITALKEYSKLATKDNCKIIVRKSLKSWIAVLPPKSFLQIHRATIINIDFIDKIIKTNERTYTVHLKTISETFNFSQRYANIMRKTFPS
jgi:DNA-binding LytR/AlgR family response regulator